MPPTNHGARTHDSFRIVRSKEEALSTRLASIRAKTEAGYLVILWTLPSITSRTTEVIGGIIILQTPKQLEQLQRPTHTTTRRNLGVPVILEGRFKDN